jgi:5'-nucleotidase
MSRVEANAQSVRLQPPRTTASETIEITSLSAVQPHPDPSPPSTTSTPGISRLRPPRGDRSPLRHRGFDGGNAPTFAIEEREDGTAVPLTEERSASLRHTRAAPSSDFATASDRSITVNPLISGEASVHSATDGDPPQAHRRDTTAFKSVSIDAFLHSDDEDNTDDGATLPEADDSAERRSHPHSSPVHERRPTAKPHVNSNADSTALSGAELKSLNAPSNDVETLSLLPYVTATSMVVPPLLDSKNSTPRGTSSAGTSGRKERVIPDWRSTHSHSHSGSGAPAPVNMTVSMIRRREDDLWKLLVGYVRVKKFIRRWRDRFAMKHTGRLRTTKNSNVFDRADESPDELLALYDSFSWHVAFQVPRVTYRGRSYTNAAVNISTTHIHISSQCDAHTFRLADVMKIAPTATGLVLRVPTVHEASSSRTQSTSVRAQSTASLTLRRGMSTSFKRQVHELQETEPLEIETPDANYIALHIFDYQSRILRSYATTLSRTMTHRMVRQLHVVHFNDVYHLPPFKPATARGIVGGASRFHTVLHQLRQHFNPLVLFSGDFMGPSLMSVITKGKQMIDAMNFLGVHYGCFGNHEFDFGLRTLKEVVHGYTQGKHIYPGSQTTWIMSNMTERDGTPLGGAKPVAVLTWNGIRVGLLGLCEDWLPQCAQLRRDEAKYHDIVECGESLARRLKEEEGCAIVLALTHNRLSIDKHLMQQCPSIDYLLGGHDHFYKSDPKNRILKSGQEFEYLSFVEFNITEAGRMGKVRIDTKPIMYDTPQSDYMKGLIERYDLKLAEKLGKNIGTSDFPLDSTEETIRFREGLLPNFILDIMQSESGADLAILGAAAIAGKEVKPPGPVSIGDVFGWFPNDTRIMTMKLKGSTIVKMLSVMVRELPAEAPSFPHPSRALSFTINMITKPPTIIDVCVNGLPIQDDGWYTVAVEEFVGVGKAKYKFVPEEGEVVVSDENASQLVHWVLDFFTKRKGTEKSVESHAREEALKTVSKVVATATRMEIDADVEKSQKFVRSVITSLLACDRASVFLVDDATGELVFTPDHSVETIRMPKGVGLAGYVAVSNSPVNIEDAYGDPRFNAAIDKQTGYRTRSVLAFPVCLEDDKVIAVVQAINKNGGLLFDDVDALKLRLLGEQVGFQLRNGEIFREATMEAVEFVNMLQFSCSFDSVGASGTGFSKLTKHMEQTFKSFAGDVSLTVVDLLRQLADYAFKLIPCEAARVFARTGNGTELITLVDDVEDDETTMTLQLEDQTVLSQCFAFSQTILVHNTRDVPIVSRERMPSGAGTALVASMTTSYGEVVGAIVWYNRRGLETRQFTEEDRFAGKYYGLFAAVSYLNTMRIQSLNELRQETNLQAVPPGQLGRIRIRGGWATVRRRLKEIPILAAMAKQRLSMAQMVDVSLVDEAIATLTSVDFAPSNDWANGMPQPRVLGRGGPETLGQSSFTIADGAAYPTQLPQVVNRLARQLFDKAKKRGSSTSFIAPSGVKERGDVHAGGRHSRASSLMSDPSDQLQEESMRRSSVTVTPRTALAASRTPRTGPAAPALLPSAPP